MFHRRCGRRITLINGKKTAVRSVTDFNHAIVFSAEKLQDDVIFEVRIDEKVCFLKNILLGKVCQSQIFSIF